MRRLTLVIALLCTACGEDPGAVQITWNFPLGRTGGCEGDATNPAVTTIRATLTEGSNHYSQQINCMVGQTLLVAEVEPGSYLLMVEALNADGVQVFGKTET